jgi:hypothetical protein
VALHESQYGTTDRGAQRPAIPTSFRAFRLDDLQQIVYASGHYKEQPMDNAELIEMGYVFYRQFADGTLAGIARLTFDRARICYPLGGFGYDRGW